MANEGERYGRDKRQKGTIGHRDDGSCYIHRRTGADSGEADGAAATLWHVEKKTFFRTEVKGHNGLAGFRDHEKGSGCSTNHWR